MKKEMMNPVKQERATMVKSSAGKGQSRNAITGMAQKRMAVCSPEKEMGRSTTHMDPDGMRELKKMKY